MKLFHERIAVFLGPRGSIGSRAVVTTHFLFWEVKRVHYTCVAFSLLHGAHWVSRGGERADENLSARINHEADIMARTFFCVEMDAMVERISAKVKVEQEGGNHE